MSIPDLYQLSDLFSTDQIARRSRLRWFIDDQVLHHANRWFQEGHFPLEQAQALADYNVFGATLKGYDCPGMSYIDYGLMMQEIERGDSGLRSFASVQSALAMYPIHAFGSEEQKEKWLPKMAKGELIGCFSLTEPDHGSDPGGLTTVAVEDGDSFIINGKKRWCTSATIADVCILFAKLNDRIQGFLIEKGTPGFNPVEITNKFSLRISVSAEISLEDCRIPKANILTDAKGLKSALSCLNQARYSIAWGVIGAAFDCFEEALKYAKQRIQFEKPIASFQLVQKQFADMWTEIVSAQLLALRLGELMDEGKADPAAISMAKRNNVRMAMEVARQCRDILGAVGILDDYHVMRHLTNLESVFTYEGTDHIHTLILGEKLTGLRAFG
ncbi:acyl-CoA dehydrogenase family protein [bacterium]|nr:acyl-CoA dehydrogenase family protein [bacterium]MBU1652721.1 acyl-CoA dehydrogenase family protein [bacterium]